MDQEPVERDPAEWEPARTPWLRRPLVRGAIALLAAGSFLILTLMSTCAPRRTVVRTTTTTTAPLVAALDGPGAPSSGPLREGDEGGEVRVGIDTTEGRTMGAAAAACITAPPIPEGLRAPLLLVVEVQANPDTGAVDGAGATLRWEDAPAA